MAYRHRADSREHALLQAIAALDPGEGGAFGYQRAAQITGLSVVHLQKCTQALGSRPITLEAVELLDLDLQRHGKPAINIDAVVARRYDALAGYEQQPVDPDFLAGRVISDLAEMSRLVQRGAGDPSRLSEMQTQISRMSAQLQGDILARWRQDRERRNRRLTDARDDDEAAMEGDAHRIAGIHLVGGGRE